MSAEEKNRLMDQLTETHLATRNVLDEIDLELVVFKDTGWRVRDIVGHMATWDQEVAKSLRDYQAGSVYLIPDLDEEEVGYNQRAVDSQQALSNQEIMTEWEQAHDELKQAVQEIPVDRFPGDMLYPWGEERGSIATLVDYMIEHDVEHRDEISKALQAS